MLSRFCRLLALGLVLAVSPFLPAQDKGWESLYFPLRVGNEWQYRWTYQVHEEQKDKKNQAPEIHKVVVRVARAEEFTRKEKTKEEKIRGFTLESVQGTKVLAEQVAVLADGVYRFGAAGKPIAPPLLFLKLPAQKEMSWSCDSVSNDTPIKGTFTLGEEKVTVPKGEFKAITSSSPKFQIGEEVLAVKYWFAPGVGMVKQELRVGNFEITLELEDYKLGK